MKYWANSKEAEQLAATKLEGLFGPDGKYYAGIVDKAIVEGERYRENFMLKLKEEYIKRTGKKL